MPDENRIRPIPLPANSFDFRETEKALDAAVRVQDESKHPERIASAVRESANMREVLEAADRPAVPEGTELGSVTAQTGQEVQAPVAIAADAQTGAEAADQEIDTTAAARAAADTDAPAAAPAPRRSR